MFTRDKIEFIIGILILLISCVFLGYIYYYYYFNAKDYYILYDEFESVDNLFSGAKVFVSGIEVGYVDKIVLNSNYSVKVAMCIDQAVQIPIDSSVKIVSSSLLGGELSLYIEPNIVETEFMKHNDMFSLSNPLLTLERIIVKFASKMIG